jgi:cyclohexanecarboxylate-CoA ligase
VSFVVANRLSMSKPRIEPELSAARIAYHEARRDWPVAGASALAREQARRMPDRVFLVEGDRRITFGEFAALAGRLASALGAMGLEPGDIVSWQLPSWIEGALLTVALDAVGCVSNPILPIYREAEVGFVVEQARSRALVVPGVFRGFDYRELARTVRARAPGLDVWVVRAEPLEGMVSLDDAINRAAPTELPRSPFGANDVSSIFYTSGTTADPKGVLHTPSTLGSYARVNAEAVGTSADDVTLLQFPLTHIGGVGSFVILPLLVGSRVVYLDVWEPAAALAAIERERVTGAGGPPAILRGLLDCPSFRPERVATLRSAATGAADVPPELIRQVRAKLGATSFRSYGMTECPMVSSGRGDDPEEKCVLTDGRAVPGARLRIVDEADRDLPPGAEGEILVFGRQLCVGYLDRRLGTGAFTADGFLRSGDLGVLDTEGYLRVTGRKKDIIIRKGENLSAKAIEDVLHEHPAIAEATVIGVADRERGERVCACVVLREEGGRLTLAELAEFMTSRGVMRQKIPEQLELLAVLPRNATGKVKKHELRARFDQR